MMEWQKSQLFQLASIGKWCGGLLNMHYICDTLQVSTFPKGILGILAHTIPIHKRHCVFINIYINFHKELKLLSRHLHKYRHTYIKKTVY